MDYFPFGMEISSRTSVGNYRYGYNGMEQDPEAKGEGNSYTTEFRQYDPRIGRWLSLDPLMAQFPWQSPYCAFDNNPVYFTDPLGLEAEGWIKEKKLDDNGCEVQGEYTWKWDSSINSLEEAKNDPKYNAIDFSDGKTNNVISQKGEFGYGTNMLLDNGTTRGFVYNPDVDLIKTIPLSQVGVFSSELSTDQQAKLLSSPITNPGAGIIFLNDDEFQKKWGRSKDWQHFSIIINDIVWECIYFASGEAVFSVFVKTKRIIEVTENVDDVVNASNKVANGGMHMIAAKTGASKLPTQIHHFATNKNKTFTPRMAEIADEFGLSLNGAWNKQALPHLGRHPNEYHKFVLQGMQNAKAGAGGSQAEFLNLFNQYVKQPVIQNPGLLRKSGW